MIINDLDDYYIVFDTKNRNTELDTLVTLSSFSSCFHSSFWHVDSIHSAHWQAWCQRYWWRSSLRVQRQRCQWPCLQQRIDLALQVRWLALYCLFVRQSTWMVARHSFSLLHCSWCRTAVWNCHWAPWFFGSLSQYSQLSVMLVCLWVAISWHFHSCQA